MQGAALESKTVGNYCPKAQAFIDFCMAEGRQWLPATEATFRLYIANLLARGTVQAASMQPYLSAINNYYEDMGFPRPAKGRGVSRAVKRMASLQVRAYVRDALWAQASRADASGQGSYLGLPWELGKLLSAQAIEWVKMVLGKLGCAPPEGGDFSGHSTRKQGGLYLCQGGGHRS
ncbi:hypothetical protein CYMTET_12948 [Cymbomonas tetramitiformis]|uniref:Integrase SAM-like N-terminal domain-containing protein n=1 Tax=Cymbomonas tetramitiformis TaxID=36881 RepID=A0AAE0GJB4_9CHLO|nr:hypothetical protein CYMTET_12948 [Cymbomonas tetramitiformis]